MQACVVGVPGTGKTYWMVQYLKKYFSYDEFFREYTIKKDVLIITNISGLKFYGSDCWDIEAPNRLGNPGSGIEGKYTREEFFTVKNMESIMEKTGKKNIILVLDEIQRDEYFPLGYKNPDVLFLFAYHRHIGMDIILGTQDASLISRGVLAQCEYLAHGTLRSKKIVGAMSYKFTDNKGNYLYSKSLKTDKEVFSAYQSASVDEVNKPKNVLLHWIIVAVVFFVVAGGLFKTALALVEGKSKAAAKAPAKHPVQPVTPASGPSSPPAAPVPVPLVPVAPVVPVASWRITPVDGYITDGTKKYYLIGGQRVETWRCRNYNSSLRTVEYYSLEPVQVGGAISRKPETAQGEAERLAQPKAEPVGEAPYTHVENKPAADYVPIPSGRDIKRDYVSSRP